jgi:hypothetical protein
MLVYRSICAHLAMRQCCAYGAIVDNMIYN